MTMVPTASRITSAVPWGTTVQTPNYTVLDQLPVSGRILVWTIPKMEIQVWKKGKARRKKAITALHRILQSATQT